ncbi:hypothetical protein HYFRA_00001724 [Hymenoscyphus fraxineus]|uniref:Zn(2)-C6 fungal-type domain-containing protein n=1 Tax=Hymenoscyphus fraxineus TaxID=746836 RepID=A0A9N9L4D9_9HELO|nr:hypothetical protein HYFRA_00001724 [Hymenoscyphus fraxineus]
MSFNNSSTFQTFVITQAFLGAPLTFTPALGSVELEQMIDAYIPGPASKSEKLSEVTIDFYNHATVDLNTGSLVRSYHVFPVSYFEQSPTESQSSGFSPAVYTPTSSAHGSFTAPVRKASSSGRVSKSKKAKKDVKKVDEPRLPGFSIMTRDGVDVTSTLGRGTKTKEQREHAHLMRIMKACDACKKKKIKCDPSHRRSTMEMSRTPSNNTKTSASSSQANPSPPAAPSITASDSFSSQNATSSFNTIDDFVLFPEGDNTVWNELDMSFPTTDSTDLSQFNFDIGLDLSYSPMDMSFNQNQNQFSNNFLPGYDMNFNDFLSPTSSFGTDQFLDSTASVSHTISHPVMSTQDSGQAENSQQQLLDWCGSGDGLQVTRIKSHNTNASDGFDMVESPSSNSSFSRSETGVNTPSSPQLESPMATPLIRAESQSSELFDQEAGNNAPNSGQMVRRSSFSRAQIDPSTHSSQMARRSLASTQLSCPLCSESQSSQPHFSEQRHPGSGGESSLLQSLSLQPSPVQLPVSDTSQSSPSSVGSIRHERWVSPNRVGLEAIKKSEENATAPSDVVQSQSGLQLPGSPLLQESVQRTISSPRSMTKDGFQLSSAAAQLTEGKNAVNPDALLPSDVQIARSLANLHLTDARNARNQPPDEPQLSDGNNATARSCSSSPLESNAPCESLLSGSDLQDLERGYRHTSRKPAGNYDDLERTSIRLQKQERLVYKIPAIVAAAPAVGTSKISFRQPRPALSSTTSPALLASSSQSLTTDPGAYLPAKTEPRTLLVPVTPTLAYKSGSSSGVNLAMTALMNVMISLGSLILVALSLSLAYSTSLLAAWTTPAIAVATCLSSTFRRMGRTNGFKSHARHENLLRLSL